MAALPRTSTAGLDRRNAADPAAAADEMVVLEIDDVEGAGDDDEGARGDDELVTLDPEDGVDDAADDQLVDLDPEDDEGGGAPAPPPSGALAADRRSVAPSREVVVRLLVAGAVATVLSSQHLVNVAERMPFGPVRTVAVAAATSFDDTVDAVALGAPDRWLREATGRPLPDDGDDRGPNLLASRPVSAETIPPTVPTTPTTGRPSGPPAADTPPTTAARTTTTVDPGPPARPVDPSDKLRVWAGGDSLGEYIGNRLLHPLSSPELSQVELDYHISTGLARPDFFDWQKELWDVMNRERPPEALVFMVGGNDNQGMRREDGTVAELGTEEWRQEYARRVAFVMDVASFGGGHLYWVGLPPMRDAGRHEVARTINAVLAEEAAVRPWVTFVDIEQRFIGPDGNYSSSIADPATGEQKVARADDGVHITLTGSTWIAEDIWAAIDQHWSLTPPPPPATAPPPTTAPPTSAPAAVQQPAPTDPPAVP